jgi:hypothetical protein
VFSIAMMRFFFFFFFRRRRRLYEHHRVVVVDVVVVFLSHRSNLSRLLSLTTPTPKRKEYY